MDSRPPTHCASFMSSRDFKLRLNMPFEVRAQILRFGENVLTLNVATSSHDGGNDFQMPVFLTCSCCDVSLFQKRKGFLAHFFDVTITLKGHIKHLFKNIHRVAFYRQANSLQKRSADFRTMMFSALGKKMCNSS